MFITRWGHTATALSNQEWDMFRSLPVFDPWPLNECVRGISRALELSL